MENSGALTPKRKFVEGFQKFIDALVNLGQEAAITMATTAVPFLGWPVISWIFKLIVSQVADALEKAFINGGSNLIIRLENNVKKADYNEKTIKLSEFEKNGDTTSEGYQIALREAREAADRLIRRGDFNP